MSEDYTKNRQGARCHAATILSLCTIQIKNVEYNLLKNL